MTIEKILREWDGRFCISRYDESTGAFFTIAVHAISGGSATGGTRAMQYTGFDAAVEDATRLAGAMTLKAAIAGLPMGGGKSVIALPAPRNEIPADQWRRILEIHAENLATLGGTYWTGPDVGTASADMDVVHAAGGSVFGCSEAGGGSGSSAPETAHGVHVAIHAAGREAGIDDLAGTRVLVQGLGAVGYAVAELVAADGAHVVATDVDATRCDRARAELGAEIIGVDEALSTPSDVFVPCATGGLIDDDTAATIQTRVIAGAANNLLAHESAADTLAARGIVLAPDFVANGGGLIHLVGREVLDWTAERVSTHVAGIGDTLHEVFDLARAENLSTQRAARQLATERLPA